VQAAHKALIDHKNKEKLSQFIATRPSIDEIIKHKQNLMEGMSCKMLTNNPSGLPLLTL
jgi:hypothetical protein